MSRSHRMKGVKVLKAVSSTIRLRILNLLIDKGPLSYTELMSSLNMNPSRDAGRFAYHLKFLLKSDLIEANVETKKYQLTELGKMLIDVAEEIEKKASKRKKMLVRTSKSALEEFDVNRITDSLMREAKMPVELAQRIAKETERRLLQSKTKYLTSPLVREVVNSILIENGLEEYRHTLTRLGLPVYDVTSFMDTKSKTSQGSASVCEAAGKSVLEEYTLLNILPRDVADAHLSGSLHIDDLSHWTLRISEIMHDLRFFLQKGLNPETQDSSRSSFPPPKNLEAALFTAFNTVMYSREEISKTQTLGYFNIFLAPFIKDTKTSDVKDGLRLFVLNMNQHANVSLGLELTVPDFLAEKPAIGPSGKSMDTYGHFSNESQLIASLLLEIIAEESKNKPLFNPKIVVKVRPETFENESAKAMLSEAHHLASERGIPYFACLPRKNQKHVVFSTSGYRLKPNWKKDWEIDTLRTGNIGCVTVNLPRIAYECKEDKTRFLEVLKERLELATRALRIKYRALNQRGKGLLPFLFQSVSGDNYFRLENSSGLVNLVGIKETVESLQKENTSEDKRSSKLDEIIQYISDFVNKTSRRSRKRFLVAMMPSPEASHRIARSDIERYGIAKIHFSGTREKPHYSNLTSLTIQNGEISPDPLREKLHKLQDGGDLTVIELDKNEYKPDELVSLTKQVFEKHDVEFFTYNRDITYCWNCKRSWFGLSCKCPSCGTTGALAHLNRFIPD